MLWTGAKFCVCLFLDSRDKSLNIFRNASGFHLQIFQGFRVQIPVNFFATLVLLRIPPRANVGSCSDRFCKCKRTPQTYVDSVNSRGLRTQFADSAYTLRIPLTICGIRLQFAGSAFSLRIPKHLKFSKHTCYHFFMNSTNCSRFRKTWTKRTKFETSSAFFSNWVKVRHKMKRTKLA